MLLEAGAKVVGEPKDDPLLKMAINHKNQEMAKLLYDYLYKGKEDELYLAHLIFNKEFQEFSIILKRMEHLNQPIVICSALKHGVSSEVLHEILIKTKIPFSKLFIDNIPLLHFSISNNELNTVEILINTGFDIEQIYDHATPIYAAAIAGNIEMVVLLIKKGANSYWLPTKGNYKNKSIVDLINDKEHLRIYRLAILERYQSELTANSTMFQLRARRYPFNNDIDTSVNYTKEERIDAVSSLITCIQNDNDLSNIENKLEVLNDELQGEICDCLGIGIKH